VRSPREHDTTDLNDQETTTHYDAFCRVERIDEPAGGFAEYSYLDFGNPTLQRTRVETNTPPGASGAKWTESYLDGLGRPYRTVSSGPDDIVADRTFNPRGGVHTATRHYFGRVKAIERLFDGQPATTTIYYDRLGRRDSMTDPVQATWTWVYDSLGRVRTERDPDRGGWLAEPAGAWTYGYDDAGRLVSQTDAKGQQTTQQYDEPGRLWTRQNTAGTVEYLYGEDRPGYFDADRLTTVKYTRPGNLPSIRLFNHDAAGRIAQQSSTVDETTDTVTRGWAPGGYQEGTTYSDSDSVGPVAYDEAGRVRSIGGILTSMDYDASGRPREKVNVNQTRTTWSYHPTRGVLTGIATDQGAIQNLGYTIDDAGIARVQTSNVSGGSWEYDYDEFYHVTEAANITSPGDSQTWVYDTGDRILSNSRVGQYVYAQPGEQRPRHSPKTVNGALYQYDANGNLLDDGGGRDPDWDANNLIERIGTTEFTYDGLGERIKKSDQSTTSVYPFGEDWEIIDGVATKYISVEGLGVIAKKVTGGSAPGTYWIHTDRLGSIDAITDFERSIVFQRTYRRTARPSRRAAITRSPAAGSTRGTTPRRG
jgi:YD repeat-containing protein